MRTHKRKVWPLLMADGVVAVLALFVFDGVAAGVLSMVALLGVLGTSIYALAGEDVNDGAGGIAGGAGW
jgi:hypothetical protein